MNLDHGERYGNLTVLRKTPSGKYLVGCSCGHSGIKVSAKKLMRGEVTSCKRCAVAKTVDSANETDR